jgi:hypothetical protein
MSFRVHRWSLARKSAVLFVSGVSVVALSITGVSSASAADRVEFAGSVPSWATTANDQGVEAADTSIEGEVYLPLRNAAAATALATAASTPGDRGYRKTMSPAQWITTFSPTQSDLDSVVGYLKSQGLTISAVPASRWDPRSRHRCTATATRVTDWSRHPLLRRCRPRPLARSPG